VNGTGPIRDTMPQYAALIYTIDVDWSLPKHAAETR